VPAPLTVPRAGACTTQRASCDCTRRLRFNCRVSWTHCAQARVRGHSCAPDAVPATYRTCAGAHHLCGGGGLPRRHVAPRAPLQRLCDAASGTAWCNMPKTFMRARDTASAHQVMWWRVRTSHLLPYTCVLFAGFEAAFPDRQPAGPAAETLLWEVRHQNKLFLGTPQSSRLGAAPGPVEVYCTFSSAGCMVQVRSEA
jgi:hypothetical protein